MLWTAVAAISRVAVWMGGAMLFAAAAIVTAEVLLRKGVGAILGTGFVFSGSDEISSLPVRGGDQLVDGVRARHARARAHRRALHPLRPENTRAPRPFCAAGARHLRGRAARALLGRGLHELRRGNPYQFAAAPAAGLGTAPMVRRHRAVLSGARARHSCARSRRCCAATMRRRRRSPAQSRRTRRSRASSRASAYKREQSGSGSKG